MRNSLLVAFLILGVPVFSGAKDTPKAELFGGYSYNRSGEANLHGWNASLALNLSDWFGIEGDISGHYATVEGTDVSRLFFLAGPRISRRGDDLTFFAHVLAGGVRTRAGVEVLGVSISASETDFGGAAGGGLDFKVADRWAIRVQGDYVVVRAEGETDGDPRASLGIVYRIGRR